MKIINAVHPELVITAFNRSETDLLNDMADLCFSLDLEFGLSDCTFEYAIEEVVTRCKAELAESDWVVTKANERGEPTPDNWVRYREALRALINSKANGAIDWPTKPERY
jgi:hypothetical protein